MADPTIEIPCPCPKPKKLKLPSENVPSPDITFALQYNPPVPNTFKGPAQFTAQFELPSTPSVTSAKAFILKDVFTARLPVVILGALPLPLPLIAISLL